MAIAYKGFQVYYCDPVTLENLQYCRTYELCVVGISAVPGNVTDTDAYIKTMLEARIPDLNQVGGIYMSDNSATSLQGLQRIQTILPLTILFDVPNNTGAAAKLKLVAANGSYAISNGTIPAGYMAFGNSFQAESYVLYDTNGNSLGASLNLTATGYAGVSYLWVLNYTGGDIPIFTGANWGFHVLSRNNSTTLHLDERTATISATPGLRQAVTDWLNAIGPLVPPPTDPYAPGGTSEPGGGNGTFDFSSEPVDFQDAPTIGAYDTGMISIYVPTAANLQALASYLWAGSFDPASFRKMVADPMDAIIGLSILPVTDTEIGTTTATLMVGNVSTGLSMPRANKQYVVIDCGTVDILPKWGAYLDFAPYSKLQLFLPYIGYVDISPDDCMNTTIAVKYTVDILSGTCIAQVKCDDHVLYEFSGTCSCSCPVTAGQYQNIVMGALRMGGAVASIAGAVASGNVSGAFSGLSEAASTAVDSVKPAISRSGGFGGSSGLMGHQYPYLILTVPRMCIPGEQDLQIGYPSYVTKTLGDLTGYCRVDTLHLAGIPASEAEQNEILQLLHEGVYL